jgi:DNA polymerase V
MTEAGIDDGDHVILRRTDVPENERIMLIQYEGQTTLKKLKIKNGITFLCWEDGSNHKPIVVNSDGYTVQGALIHIVKTPR